MQPTSTPLNNTTFNFQKNIDSDLQTRTILNLRNTITDQYWEDPLYWTPERKYTAAQARRLWKDRYFIKDKHSTYFDNLGKNFKLKSINSETLDAIKSDDDLSNSMYFIDIRSQIRSKENPFDKFDNVNIPLLEIGDGGAFLLTPEHFEKVYAQSPPTQNHNVVFIHDDINHGLSAAQLWLSTLKWDESKLFFVNAHDFLDIPKNRWMYRDEPVRLSAGQINRYMRRNPNNNEDE